MRATTIGGWALALILAGGTAACGGDEPGDDVGAPGSPAATAPAQPAPEASTATPRSDRPLHIKVVGSCKNGNAMTLESSGFTPNGAYTTQAWYPDGRKYSFIQDGQAGPDGDTPNWSWACTVTGNGTPDPKGAYKLLMTDVATGRTAQTTFKVDY